MVSSVWLFSDSVLRLSCAARGTVVVQMNLKRRNSAAPPWFWMKILSLPIGLLLLHHRCTSVDILSHRLSRALPAPEWQDKERITLPKAVPTSMSHTPPTLMLPPHMPPPPPLPSFKTHRSQHTSSNPGHSTHSVKFHNVLDRTSCPMMDMRICKVPTARNLLHRLHTIRRHTVTTMLTRRIAQHTETLLARMRVPE